jgi:hypothetical protein
MDLLRSTLLWVGAVAVGSACAVGDASEGNLGGPRGADADAAQGEVVGARDANAETDAAAGDGATADAAVTDAMLDADLTDAAGDGQPTEAAVDARPTDAAVDARPTDAAVETGVDAGPLVYDVRVRADRACSTLQFEPAAIDVPAGTSFTVNWINATGCTEISIDMGGTVPIVIGLEPGRSHHDKIRQWCGTFTGKYTFRAYYAPEFPARLPVNCAR